MSFTSNLTISKKIIHMGKKKSLIEIVYFLFNSNSIDILEIRNFVNYYWSLVKALT